MMNSEFLPPIPSLRDLQTLFALVELLADPKVSQQRIAEFAKAADDARQIVEQAAKDRAAVEQLKETTRIALDAMKKQHDATLGAEREAHDESSRRRTDELDAREKRLNDLQAKAEADAAEAARIKADMQRRIKLVTEAA